LSKEKEYIIYEIVSAPDILKAEILAQSNDINPEIQLLEDFLENQIDYDAVRDQVLEEEGQNENDIRNDLD